MQSEAKASGLLSRFYGIFICSGNFFQHFFLLVFRLYWGWQFYLTGKGKLLNHEKTVEFFTSLNIPMPDLNAWFVGGVECVGGLLLLFGFISRPIGLILGVNMIVAYLTVEDDRATILNIFQDPQPFLSADPFFFMLTGLMVFAFGPGLFSLDGIIKKLRK